MKEAARTAAAPERERVIEAAPARAGIRLQAFAVCGVFLILALRALVLSVSGDPVPPAAAAAPAPIVSRADLTDRTGALMAANVRGYTLIAEPANVWDADEAARALRTIFPELDANAVAARMRRTNRQVVYLRQGLSPRQRAQVLELGLAGVGFEQAERRVYPMGTLGAHALGYVGRDLAPLAGLERGLNARIEAAGRTGGAVRLSLDARIQYAVESELAAAARAHNATGAAAVVLDGRTGETLALASWPSFDPNRAGAANDNARLNRAVAARFEMGSTLKPFTVAMALEERLTSLDETFNLAAPFAVDGQPIRDLHPILGPARLREIIAQSSNIGAARLALRVGATRQHSYLSRLGLMAAAPIELAESAAPIAPARTDRLSVAILGYGHGLAITLTSLAGAYTVFTNDGARVAPTLLARAPGEPITRTRVFSPGVARSVVALMRAAVTEGTGRRADAPGLEMAGKTGTAEKPGAAGYDVERMLSSFAGVFPASDPRYVIVLALDEPRRTNAADPTTGGAVAAPVVGRIAARIAPALGLTPARP